MTKEEKLILTTVNLALEVHRCPERFEPNRYFPMTRVFVCNFDRLRTARIWTGRGFRRLDVFEERPGGSHSGNILTLGTYSGTGWLPQLAQDAVDAVTSPPQVPR